MKEIINNNSQVITTEKVRPTDHLIIGFDENNNIHGVILEVDDKFQYNRVSAEGGTTWYDYNSLNSLINAVKGTYPGIKFFVVNE